MSKKYYAVPVEKLIRTEGIAYVRARGRARAVRLAEKAVQDHDLRIDWAYNVQISERANISLTRQLDEPPTSRVIE